MWKFLRKKSKFWAAKRGGEDEEMVSHPALEVFVVLKHIFRHLSDSDLRNARLVNRNWNFTAVSELITRNYNPPPMKLYSFSSNEFRDRDYGWYLNFENSRRSLWIDSYGVDCPILEFRHLHFLYMERTDDFLRVLRSTWLTSVTNLSLSMLESTYKLLLAAWFLPAFPNLKNLSCFLKSDLPEIVDADFNGVVGPDLTSVSLEQQESSERSERPLCFKLHSVSVCFEEACSFCWPLFDLFAEIQTLKLEFRDPASLIRCANDLTSTASNWEFDNLQITLTHKENLAEQVEEELLNTQAFVTANAKLCNKFRPKKSLSVLSMIPFKRFYIFLDTLTRIQTKQVEFETAVPCNKSSGFQQLTHISQHLISKIGFKFPVLSHLNLQYLQHESNSPFRVLRRVVSTLAPSSNVFKTLKTIHISTIPAKIDFESELGRLLIPVCGIATLINTRLQQLTEVLFEVIGVEDFVAVIHHLTKNSIRVKKLVFRASSKVFLDPAPSSWLFFPKMFKSFPTTWLYGTTPTQEYQGLPGLSSLEEFCVERVGILYRTLVEAEIRKMPNLKFIYLDANCNAVIDQRPSIQSLQSKIVHKPHDSPSTWPTVVGHVQIFGR